ncbi:hypothetical protein Bbelb_400830 [Branchiostoma belcheri]|nr:hypothetical protein Bbelb_400830 [Branchiostoma belcheri]
MLYNCNSWAAPVIEKLDTCHRKHLRAITGLQWPRSRVTNDTLYKVCNTEPLSVKVEKLRRSLAEGLGPPTIEKKLKRAREAEDTVERDEERLNAATGHFHTTVDAEHSR